MTIIYVLTTFLGISILSCVYLLLATLKSKRRNNIVTKFTDYASVLEYHMNKAYEIIHKDRILVYSLDASRVNDEDFNVISQDFARLVIKLIGPNLYKEFVFLYGDEDTLIFNMIEYFNTRYEADEVRKSSMDTMMEKQEGQVDNESRQY
jgi:hypothetical protein